MYTAVVYRDGVEIDRWSPVPKGPGPAHWLSGDLLMMKNLISSKVTWTRKQWQYWKDYPEDEVPKELRLLALLE